MDGSSRAEWLQARRSGIGGSDAAAVLGVSRYATPYQVYLDKRGELPEPPESPAMFWGRALEPAIRQRYADATGRTVRVPGRIVRHRERPYLLATLDGVTDDGRVLEIKTARSAEGWGEPGSDEIPEAYLCQVQHYLMVTGLELADVAVLIGGQDFRLYEVRADRELQELMAGREAEFWGRVERGEPPDAASMADLALRFRHPVAATVPATPGAVAAVAGMKALKAEQKLLEAEEERLKIVIQACMGEMEGLTIDGRLAATWKAAKPPSRFDHDAFRAAHPELYRQYLKTGEAARRFLLK
ncbi:YqaJ viral recombinase family protein [Oryzomonas sagensis]|uniref:YqaJ viral recombinase family protein n=1 Tax=Oryzomonas sagensis TaxID=2603857 RepID=A0ABQ6TNQ3_9BACT|nr:YqaJ viral recombinase family protein [Oryzomonas sagensis]KAB0670281.1 YqaJ viral recombinase family protein [Oryzomonas sagensis]